MLDLPRKPGDSASLWETMKYLRDMAEFLGDSAVAVQFGIEGLMALSQAQRDQLTAGVAANAAANAEVLEAVAELQTETASQITDLAEAIRGSDAPDPAVVEQLTALEGQTSTLQSSAATIRQIVTNLKSDNRTSASGSGTGSTEEEPTTEPTQA